MKKRKSRRKIQGTLLLLCLLLTGCAPEEKTLLLPLVQSAEEEAEGTDSGKDFSVKRIYAYTYKASEFMTKSAFLQGCGENIIHIAAVEEQEDGIGEQLVYREVDYRYGFYDTAGTFFSFIDDCIIDVPEEGKEEQDSGEEGQYMDSGEWQEEPGSGKEGQDTAPGKEGPEKEGPEKEEQYLDSGKGEGMLCMTDIILPSPDGKHLLVYLWYPACSIRVVRLYTLGEQERELYEGPWERNFFLKGSFSPDGRWAAFDVAGALTGDKRPVLVYDCLKSGSADPDLYWEGERYETAYKIYPPDEVFDGAGDVDVGTSLWSAQLYSASGGRPGLVSFLIDYNNQNLYLEAEYTDEEGEGGKASRGKLCLLGTNTEEHEEENTETGGEPWETEAVHTMVGKLLAGDEGMPYIQYRVAGNMVYYMGNVFRLWYTDMTESGEKCESIRVFPEMVWDFLPLETGDFLVLTADDTVYSFANESKQQMNGRLGGDGTASPRLLQDHWGIQSGDLYLYPADGSERRLLYKNVQNFLGMEYDAQGRRILLETYEEGLGQRRCIILEL